MGSLLLKENYFGKNKNTLSQREVLTKELFKLWLYILTICCVYLVVLFDRYLYILYKDLINL